MYCNYCGNLCNDTDTTCACCGATLAGSSSSDYSSMNSGAVSTTVSHSYSMKWYKFLKFALILGALSNLVTGIQMLTGMQYGTEADKQLVYAFYDGLEMLDMGVGIAMVGLAIFAIYTRSRLAKYCKDGPTMLLINYAANAVVGLVYTIGMSSIVPEYVLGDSLNSNYVSLGVSIGMIIANYIYFNKRKDLFVN